MERKNIFDKNKFDRKKALYYILMAVCVIVIGAISFITYKSVQNSMSEIKIDNKTDNVDKVDTNIDNISEPVKQEVAEKEEALPKESEVKEQAPAPTVETKEYIFPVSKGDITVKFSLSEPVYSTTLKDWRMHDGVDIAANIGDNVVAVNDGAVETVKADDLMGITVVIKHTDGKKSTYCNLDDSIELEEGQIINQGDIIGKVGNTALFEISDGPHLHFELSENGKKIDPMSVLKVQE